MPVGCVVRASSYFDSVFLMRVADRIGAQKGVERVAAVMATEANKGLLAEADLRCADADAADADDLVIAVRAHDDAVVRDVLSRVDEWLAAERPASAVSRARSLDDALSRLPGANVAVISVPGEYAAAETRRALERGLHVFLFSDNVRVADEVALKRYATERGLLVMGPDCGTAIVKGIGLGFANAVRRGPVGVVGASGTGMQEIASLVHGAGSGISHAIGTGTHDPSDEVGGVTTLHAISALDADRGTAVIVLVSKPPGPRALSSIKAAVAGATKPVVACFLGADVDPRGAVWDVVRTLDDAAVSALRHVGVEAGIPAVDGSDGAERRSRRRPEQRYVRGLFAGGSLCYQAQDLFRARGLELHSNAPLDGVRPLEDPLRSVGHTLVDLGADEFTRGRPHPMIDPRLRRERILREAADPDVAILLLDVILGYGCAPDPAGGLRDAILEAREKAAQRGGELTVIASVTGTDWDPQRAGQQAGTLKDAGGIVTRSAAEAARLAAALVAA